MLEHSGAPKTDPAAWSRARRTAGALAKALFDEADVVVAEGDFLDERARDEYAAMLPEGVPTRFVTLTVPLEAAFGRVDADPTRGLSRDRPFLAGHYAELAAALARRPDGDLCLDTGALTLAETVAAVLAWLD
jgi:hypothetical protein